MCGQVDLGEQKDIKIYKRDGGSYTPKSNTAGNPGSMLPVMTDAMPDKVQQFRWGLLTEDDDRIHSKINTRVSNRCSWRRCGRNSWEESIVWCVSKPFLNITRNSKRLTASSGPMEFHSACNFLI